MTVESRLPRLGLALSLIAILLGFTLGGVFGIAEDSLKGHLKASAEAARETVYRGDEEAMRQTLDKSWTYMKRAHLHLGAIGTAALAQSLLLVLLDVGLRFKQVVSGMLGAGAIGYGLFWLAAGLRAPGLGGTGPAKESLAWLGQPTAALCLAGTLLVLWALARSTPARR